MRTNSPSLLFVMLLLPLLSIACDPVLVTEEVPRPLTLEDVDDLPKREEPTS